MTALAVCGTPASTNGVASATMHVVHALLTLAQGATAPAKFWGADIGHVTAGGGLSASGGGDSAGGGELLSSVAGGGGVSTAPGGGDDG